MRVAPSSSPARILTADELMALPEDGIRREIIRGELREQPSQPHTRKHSSVAAKLACILCNWLDEQPETTRGRVLSGDAGFRLLRDPETLVGIDVAYASAELVARTDEALAFYDGPPVLAVEILSPSDQHKDIVEKVGLYLEVGSVVWLVDPDFRIVTVHQPGQEPEAFNARQELSGEPYLPGFRIAVRRLFEA